MSEHVERAPQSAPPTEPGEVPGEDAGQGEPLERYNSAAETVGFIPSLRAKDNVVQAVFIVLVTGGFALFGWLRPVGEAFPLLNISASATAIVLGLVGLVLSTIVSGLILMVLGWVRASRKRRRSA